MVTATEYCLVSIIKCMARLNVKVSMKESKKKKSSTEKERLFIVLRSESFYILSETLLHIFHSPLFYFNKYCLFYFNKLYHCMHQGAEEEGQAGAAGAPAHCIDR